MKESQRFDTAEALDDRDSDDPDFEVDDYFSCTNTDFGGRDPSMDDSPPKRGVEERGLRY
jgi:hypothetical protein